MPSPNPGAVESFPVLPLRDIVVFPHMIVPLFVGREKSIRALEEVMRADRFILLATQKNAADDDPATDAIFTTGTLASVLQLLKLPDGTVKVLVEGVARASLSTLYAHGRILRGRRVRSSPDAEENKIEELEALSRSVVSEFENYVKLNKKVSPEVVAAVTQIDDYSKLADTVASHLAVKIADKQAVLEMPSVTKRLEKCLSLMEGEISVLQVEKRIRTRVKRQMEKTQREYYLNEQMKAIQKELGDEDGKDDLSRTRRAHQGDETVQGSARQGAGGAEEAAPDVADVRRSDGRAQLSRLAALDSVGQEVEGQARPQCCRSHVLDADHFGLEKVKERIVEYLAVQSRANKLTGPILCLVGPPGVGKTSLGKSIAKATGREFVRMSLGGVRDEAEIRGHRRTYIGSMPGKIIQSMRKAKTANPLFLLDEIDKMGQDFRGDPSSAHCSKCSTPSRTQGFNDHYLEVDYDLSNVMFVTTANTLNIPAPLDGPHGDHPASPVTRKMRRSRSRVSICCRILIKKHGLAPKEFALDDSALRELIRRYTREAGVRNLEREIVQPRPQGGEGNPHVEEGQETRFDHGDQCGKDYLGVARYRYGEAESRGSGWCGHRSRVDRSRRRAC